MFSDICQQCQCQLSLSNIDLWFRFIFSSIRVVIMSNFGNAFDQSEVDPAAEFLAREQDELAGLEDEVKPAAISVPVVNGGKLNFCHHVWGAYQTLL